MRKPTLTLASTELLDDEEQRRLVRLFDDINVEVVLAESLERRGAVSELWQFVLAADWSAIRDNLIAAALGAGGVQGGKALARGGVVLAEKLKASLSCMPSGRPGRLIIRDTLSGLELEIISDQLLDRGGWDQILNFPSTQGHYYWDAERNAWSPDAPR